MPFVGGQPLLLSFQRIAADGAAAGEDLATYREVGAPQTAAKPTYLPAFTAGDASLLVPQTNLAAAVAALRRLGVADAIATQTVEYAFQAENPLFAALSRRLPAP